MSDSVVYEASTAETYSTTPNNLKSNLDLIAQGDSFPYPQDNPELYSAHVATYYHFFIPPCEIAVGYMLPSVASVFEGIPCWEINHDERTLTLVTTNTHDEAERSLIMERTTLAMRETGHFEILKGWRNELYPIFGDAKGGRELLANVERAASALFGIVTYGVHMTAYVRTGYKRKRLGDESDDDGEIKIWVPRRSYEKETYKGMLDNTVAGGIATGENPFKCLIRESQEEASLPEDLVRKRAKATGAISYFHIRDKNAGGETGLLQPECQYCYDIEVDEDQSLRPGDDEVHSFELMTIDQVQKELAQGNFKPNCALVLLDFLIRHGVLTTENERDYTEIVARLHRRLEFPTA